jgi:rubrerythrin
MATREEMLEVVNEGNWENCSGELRCRHCGRWDYEGEHDEDCPLGAVLDLI